MIAPALLPLADELRAAVGDENVLVAHAELAVYECDGFVIEKNSPDVVVFPRSTADVAAIVRLCNRLDVPFLPRGAGTSLAGGCLPVGGGVMIVLTRMKRIVEINLRDRYAVVEPGVVNVWLTNALKGTGYHYAPDPSSQGACTIGGNVATNSGGPHTLKYGVTVNHTLGVEAVMADGSIVQFGGPAEDHPGLRPGRHDRRQRGHLGNRHQGLGPADAQSRGRADPAGRVRFVRRRHELDQRDHRRGHHPRGAGNDGPGNSGRGRGGVSLRLSLGCQGNFADRSRRAGSGARRAARADHRVVHALGGPRGAASPRRGRAAAAVEMRASRRSGPWAG